MSKHTVFRTDPAPIAPNRFSQNGRTANPAPWQNAAQAINQAAVLRKKCHFTWSYGLPGTNSPIPSASTLSNLQVLLRTGKNVSRIKAIIGAMTASSGNTLASCYLNLIDSSGASTTSSVMRCTNRSSSLGTWEHGIQFGTVTVDSPDEDALYRCGVVLTNSARILSIAIFDESDLAADTSSDVCADPTAFQVGANVYDSHTGKVLTAGTSLWKHCAPPLIAWSRNEQSAAPTFSSTTYANILDTSFTSLTNAPGFYLDTQYLTTRSRTTVPCLLLVHATRLTGTGSLYVRLRDGSTTITSSAITSPLANPCYSEAIALPAQTSTRWAVEAAVSSGSWRLEAVSLLQYEV